MSRHDAARPVGSASTERRRVPWPATLRLRRRHLRHVRLPVALAVPQFRSREWVRRSVRILRASLGCAAAALRLRRRQVGVPLVRWVAHALTRTPRAVVAAVGCVFVAAIGLVVPAQGVATSSSVPAYDHIFVVSMGGQAYSNVIGPAPYLTALAASGATASAYQAVDPSSLADQFAMTAGQTFGVTDCLPSECPQPGASLPTLVESAGRTWKAYAESMPSPCALTASGDYVPEHVPFVYMSDLATACSTAVVPLDAFATDLASAASTPNLAWVVPNQQDDMVVGSVAQGDSWANSTIRAILASPAWTGQHSLLLVVFDQPGSSTGGPLPFIAVASDGTIAAGSQSAAAFTPYSMLSTIEHAWSLGSLTANDAAAAPMADLFLPTSTPTPAPSDTSPATPSPVTSATPSTLATVPATSESTVPPITSPATPSTAGASAPPTATATPVATATPAGEADALTTSPSPQSSPAPFAAPVLSADAQAPPLIAATTTTGTNEFTIAMPAVQVVNFQYQGTARVPSGDNPSLLVMRFTATSLVISSPTTDPAILMRTPCTTINGTSVAMQTTVPAGSVASLSGGVTLDLTALSFTYNGTSYSLLASTAPTIPPLSPFPVLSGILTGVSEVAASISAGTASFPNVQHGALLGC